MITVGFPAPLAAEQSAETRTVRGVGVPWNVEGRVSDGQLVRFLPGALDAASRPVTLRDHDRARPVGRVVAAESTADGLSVAAKITRTRDGDDTLTLAADGVLMFSVGVNPTQFHHDGDTLVVEAADWQELSLLPIGAFSDAVVTDVAATAPTPKGSPMSDTATVPVEVIAPPVEVAAAAPTPERPTVVPLIAASRPPATSLTLQGLAELWAASTRGEMSTDSVRARIAAALTDVTLAGTTNVGAIAQPAYRSEIVGLIDQGRPLIDHLASAPLPASGMSIEFPKWSAQVPEVALQATEKSAVHSAAVAMTLGTAPVLTWAGANDISLQAVERSSPSFLEAYLRAAAIDFAKKTDAYVASTLLAAAAVVTPGADFVANIAALIGAMDPAATPGGALFVAVSQDVGVGLIGVKRDAGPAFWDGTVTFGSMPVSATAGGLSIFIDTNLPAKTYLAGSRQGATWHQNPGAPADIRVVDVSLLGLDVGVYGFGALTVEWPGSFQKLTTV
jgi:HK97 family phage prohead protease